MKATFERAKRVIAAFNANEDKVKAESEIFFAHAVEMICAEDGMRVSPVLKHAGYLYVVLEVADGQRKKHRLLAVWKDGRGEVLEKANLPPGLHGKLAYEPEVHSAYPEGMATFIPERLEKKFQAAEPKVVKKAAAKVRHSAPWEHGVALPQSTRDVPGHVLAKLLEQMLPQHVQVQMSMIGEMLFHAEQMACRTAGRKRAFVTVTEGLQLLKRNTLPADTVNVVEHQIMDLLGQLTTVKDPNVAFAAPERVRRVFGG